MVEMIEPNAFAGEKPATERQGDTAAAAVAAGAGQADILTIERPPAGMIKVVDVAAAKNLKFAFSLSDTTVTILDVDVVLMFPDGGKLLMPAFMMQLITAEPPRLQFGNLAVDPQSVIAAAGDVRLADPLPRLAISENAKVVEKAQEDSAQTPQVVQMPAAQNFANTPAPAQRAEPIQIGIQGDALHESNGRYAKKIDLQEQQSSSLKSEGAITTSTEKTPIELVTAQMQAQGQASAQALEKLQAQGQASAQALEKLQAQVEALTRTSTGGKTLSIPFNGWTDQANIVTEENVAALQNTAAISAGQGQNFVFALAGGPDAALFTINQATGALTFNVAPNFEMPGDAGGNNIYNITVAVSDGNVTDTQDIAVIVTNQNEAPVITSNGGGVSAAFAMSENGTAVTNVMAIDPDAGAVVVYSIIGGADAGKFTINAATGVLTFITAPNFEAPTDAGANNVYDVIVHANDGALTDTQALAVTITNQNEAPVITSNGGGVNAAISIAENGLGVTTVAAIDPDAGATRTYSIAGGMDAARFTINPVTGVLTFVSAPNFEAPTDAGANNVYDVIVQVSDGLLTDTQAIAVTVTDNAELPVITSNGGGVNAAISLSENGTAVTTVAATHPDPVAVLNYSISGGADAARFTINATTGVLTFVTAPNFEAPADVGADNVYDVTVQVSDGALTDSQAIAVTVTNQNEAPVITSNGGGAYAALSVSENGTAITTVTATDQDASTTLTYSVVGGADAARFTINPATGALVFNSPANFELPTDADGDNVYRVRVQVSDGTLTDFQDVDVTVTNQNEAPVITSNGGGVNAAVSISENSTAVTTVAVSDPDAGATQTYSISGGADAARFTINATTGVLTFVTAPNFEAPTDVGGNNVYDVTVQVSDGTLTDTQAIAVTVTNVNEAPNIISLSNNSLNENASFNTVIGTVFAADPEGSFVTFRLTDDAGGAFWIRETTGELMVWDSRLFDYEDKTSHQVTVEARDASGTASTATYTINVNNLADAANTRVFQVVTSGHDNSTGGSTNDIYIGSAGNDTIFGADGNDLFLSGDGNDTHNGGNGSDEFNVSLHQGVDTIIGGTGSDVLYVEDSGYDSTLNLTASGSVVTGTNSSAQTVFTTTEVEKLEYYTNSSGGVLNVGAGMAAAGITSIEFYGELGDDVVSAAASDVFMYVRSGNGNDTLTTGSGNDDIDGGNGNNTINSGAGDDIINTGSGTDLVIAGSGNDNVDTFDGNDTIYGGDGNDDLDGRAGDDLIYGENGNDALFGDSGNDTIDGGAGDDTIDAGEGNDTVYSGLGNDLLIGGNGNDSLIATAGAGNTTFRGGAGDDLLDDSAGFGRGIADYSDQTGAVTVSLLLQGAAQNTVSAGNDTLNGMNDLIGGSGNDTLIGDNRIIGNILTGGGGNDTIYGNDGNDTLNGGDGDDNLYGGIGNDTVNGGNGLDRFYVGIGQGNDTITGGAGNDIVFISDGTTHTVNLSASGSVITATDASAQTIFTATDVHEVEFDTGSTGGIYNVGSGFIATGITWVSLGGGIGDDVVSGATCDVKMWIQSGSGNDSITTGLGDDYIEGGDGNDIINANGGNDTLWGGAGADTLNGGSGIDKIIYYNDAVGVTINLATQTVSGGDGNGDTISGIEEAAGGSGNDSLTGDNGNNSLEGMAGNDTLNGLGGNDYIDGGSGNGDTANYSGDREDYTISFNSGTGEYTITDLRGGSPDGTDTLINVENVIIGGISYTSLSQLVDRVGTNSNDTMIGNSWGEVFLGNGGPDYILGEGGDDRIEGGTGNDTLDGGTGDDIVRGGDGNDTIAAYSGADTLMGEAGSDNFYIDGSILLLPGMSLAGGLNSDTVSVEGSTSITLADIVSKITTVELIDLDSGPVAANLTNFKASDATSLLGASGPGNTLTLVLDANDTFSVQAGEFHTQFAGNYVFYSDAGLTNEIARVNVF